MFPAGREGYRVRFIRVGGELKIRLVENGPEAGPVLLLVHGWGASAYEYRHTMPVLAAHGYRVVAVDLPGHGLSDKPLDPAAYRMEHLAGCLIGVLDDFHGVGVVLVGHSMGAALAGRVAALRGGLRGLVLMSPVGLGRVRDLAVGRVLTPGWAVRAVPLMARRFAVAIALRFAYSGGEGGLLPSAQDIDEYWAPAQFPGYAIALRHLIHEFSWQLTDPSWLAHIACPTLVISGANDRLVDPASAAAYAQAIPHAQLALIPNGAHAIAEQRPAEVNAALVAFLRDFVKFPT